MRGPGNSPSDRGEIDESGLVAQLAVMSRGLKASPTRKTVALLVVALFIVIAATAFGQIRLNGWNQPFFDALSRRDFARFMAQLGIFGIIASALLALNVAQRWLGEMLKLKLRQGLVQDLVQNWLVPGLDDDTRRRVSEVIVRDLAGSGIIHIGRTTLHGDLFGRVLHLVNDPEARRFQPGAAQQVSYA
jgi:hypothetical protein